TVRLAHQYSILDQDREDQRICLESNEGPSWDHIWKIHVPFRIQFFLWKAIQDGIPTKANLWFGDSNWDTICPRCGVETETTTHALFFCTKNHEFWSNSALALDMRNWRYTDSVRQTLQRFFQLRGGMTGPPNFYDTIMYVIWMSRNELIFEQKRPEPAEALKRAKQFLITQDRTAPIPPRPVPPTPQASEGWHAINVDASWTKPGTPGGTGFTIKSHTSSLICAGYDSARAANPEEVEAIAVIRGM
ncbi:hypothetical protein GIB67_034451, partial [Kingdonia uniflora]